MASDKLHLSKKWNTVFIHLAAWSILFIFPLLFIERFGNINRMHNFSLIKFYIQPICIACIFYINYLWLIDKVLFRKKTIRFILYNLLLIVMANVAIYLVHRMVIPESILHQRPTPIPPPRPGFMQWQDSITLVLVVGLSAAIKVTQKWITTEKERKQLEQERTEAELKNLKNQLNPHFLFNTLNALYGLVLTKSDKTESAFIQFSNILKYMYAQTTSETIPVCNEIDYIRQYVDLQALRLNKHTHISFETQTDDDQAPIPPMILITFVENAFKYGTSSDIDCTVLIRIIVKNGQLLFETENTVMKEKKEKTPAIGIENCRKRLELLYPDRFNLTTVQENRQYKIRLTIRLQ